ncbi:MAG: hypothetical protein K6B70_05950 [Clostridia bacterium]|nr:hypothetical protein [Clostridia bacterium]
MSKFEFQVNVSGVLKGCEIISYNSDKHKLYTARTSYLKKGRWSGDLYLSPKYIGESQYKKIIEYYVKDRQYFETPLNFLFKTQEIENQIQYIYDEVLEDDKYRTSLRLRLFELMTPVTRAKNAKYIDKIFLGALQEQKDAEIEEKSKIRFGQPRKNITGKMYAQKMIKYMDDNQIDKYYKDIIDLVKEDNGVINIEGLINIWKDFDYETQHKRFIEFISIIKENIRPYEEKVLENNYEEIQYYLLLTDFLKASNEKIKKEYLPQFLNEYRDENGVFKLRELGMFTYFEKIDMPNDIISEITNTYLNSPQYIAYYSADFWRGLSEKNQKDNLIKLLDYNNKIGFPDIWMYTSADVRRQLYDDVIAKIEKEHPKLEHDFKGKWYLDLLRDLSEEDRNNELTNNVLRFLGAIKEKYKDDNKSKELDINKYTNSYNLKICNALLELEKRGTITVDNADEIIKNLPVLGDDIVNRVMKNNSEYITQNSGVIISELAKKESKDEINILLNEIENVFSQNNLPTFVKLYKYFELMEYDKNITKETPSLSPVFINAKSMSLSKRVIFSDLLKVSMDSNNKSLKEFIMTLEKGNEIYKNVMFEKKDIESLEPNEKETAQRFIKTVYALYEQTEANNIDKEANQKMLLTGNIQKDFEIIGKRYSHDGKIQDLPDRVLKNIVGPYQEFFEGIDTVSKMKDYMEKRVQDSNDRHRKMANEKLELETGDLIKGIKNGVELFPYIVSDGVRAGEFLGKTSHSDFTPLDADFSIILDKNKAKGIEGKIGETVSSAYGNLFVVLKYDPSRIEYSRKNTDVLIDNENVDLTLNEKIMRKTDKDIKYKRVNDRANGEFDKKKIEVFSSHLWGEECGVRTGIGITDVDYILIRSEYDKRLGYELAMNGTYIPIINSRTEQLVFSPDDYDKIREKMQGLSYYDAGDFIVDKSAYNLQAKEIVDELFKDGNVEESTSQKEAAEKRNAINRQVAEALYDSMKLDMEDHVTGNVTNGFVEFIDTGSTGRGTNVPGDGDFDFMMKIDKMIIDNPNEYEQLKKSLRDKLATASEEKESKATEIDKGFRYKKVKIEGVAEPLDIDISFVSKNENITYSTDMCVKDRLENIKKTDPEGYKYTIANIVLAKRFLKEKEIYKKTKSEGATEYGGFGGVGVENWILQNGGSLKKAMETFMEASEKSEDFYEFREKYPIFDFGQNHMGNNYQHDSFIRGITPSGYEKMLEEFEKMKTKLTPMEYDSKDSKQQELIKAKQEYDDAKIKNGHARELEKQVEAKLVEKEKNHEE